MYKTPLITLIIGTFLLNSLGSLPAYANELVLPAPGVMVHLSPEFNPAILKGVTVHPDNPFKFDFILDRGEGKLSNDVLKDESKKLVKYFLSAITTPEKDLWVNLSPYEKHRIIPDSFGQTDMGRDLLAQDYMLKQITASLIYPEDEVGKKFWKRVYEEAAKKFGNTNIPVNTFNKVWIIPDHAKVYEHGNTAFVVKANLKVMLEEDYLALDKLMTSPKSSVGDPEKANALGSQIIREIVIPQLEKEVNEGKNFSKLRQVYNSLILAVWFKKRMKDSILGRKYMDQNKVTGIDIEDKDSKQKIYEQYLKAFKKGVYNYIKEETDPITQEITLRKYFSGGFAFPHDFAMHSIDYAQTITPDEAMTTGDVNELNVELGQSNTENLDLKLIKNIEQRAKNPLPTAEARQAWEQLRRLADTSHFKEALWAMQGLIENNPEILARNDVEWLEQQMSLTPIKNIDKTIVEGSDLEKRALYSFLNLSTLLRAARWDKENINNGRAKQADLISARGLDAIINISSTEQNEDIFGDFYGFKEAVFHLMTGKFFGEAQEVSNPLAQQALLAEKEGKKLFGTGDFYEGQEFIFKEGLYWLFNKCVKEGLNFSQELFKYNDTEKRLIFFKERGYELVKTRIKHDKNRELYHSGEKVAAEDGRDLIVVITPKGEHLLPNLDFTLSYFMPTHEVLVYPVVSLRDAIAAVEQATNIDLQGRAPVKKARVIFVAHGNEIGMRYQEPIEVPEDFRNTSTGKQQRVEYSQRLKDVVTRADLLSCSTGGCSVESQQRGGNIVDYLTFLFSKPVHGPQQPVSLLSPEGFHSFFGDENISSYSVSVVADRAMEVMTIDKDTYYHNIGMNSESPVDALYGMLNSGYIGGIDGGFVAKGTILYTTDPGRYLYLAIKGEHISDQLVNKNQPNWFTGLDQNENRINIQEAIKNKDITIISTLNPEHSVMKKLVQDLKDNGYPVEVIYRSLPKWIIKKGQQAAVQSNSPVNMPKVSLLPFNTDHAMNISKVVDKDGAPFQAYPTIDPIVYEHITLADFSYKLKNEKDRFKVVMFWMPRFSDLERIFKLAQRMKGVRKERPVVVEIGSGNGLLSYLLAKFFDVDIVAIDPDKKLVQKAQAIYGSPMETKKMSGKVRYVEGRADNAGEIIKQLGIDQPELVLNSWMPYGEDFTDDIKNIHAKAIVYIGEPGLTGTDDAYNLNESDNYQELNKQHSAGPDGTGLAYLASSRSSEGMTRTTLWAQIRKDVVLKQGEDVLNNSWEEESRRTDKFPWEEELRKVLTYDGNAREVFISKVFSEEDDKAMKSMVKVRKKTDFGGIDLTANRMNLDIEKDKAQISQPMDLKALENIEINALYIKSIEIKPLTNLPQLLGVSP